MSNNRDEKFESPEESEYHFSDEEVSYEVETETPTKPTPPPPPEPSGGNFFSRLTRTRRMGISLVIFLALVFIVYKVIAPSTTTPATEIAPAMTAQQKPMTPAPNAPVANVYPAYQAPAAQPQVVVQAQPVQQPMQAAQQIPTQPNVINPPVAQTTQVVPVQQAANTPPPPVTSNVVPVVSAVHTMPTQPILPQTTMAQQPSVTTTVQQTTQPGITVQPGVSVPTTTETTVATQLPPDAQVRMATLSQENQKLMVQLQADYTQKMNDFVTQNKNLQDEVQLLSTRVATMETELNRLMQTVTRRQTAINTMKASQPMPHVIEHQPRIPLTVQAIIPGRAWLKADSGETVTVAEGDLIKGLGRVSKIDPYDGVVEVNTGSRILSLSYGSGG